MTLSLLTCGTFGLAGLLHHLLGGQDGTDIHWDGAGEAGG